MITKSTTTTTVATATAAAAKRDFLYFVLGQCYVLLMDYLLESSHNSVRQKLLTSMFYR